VKSNFKSINIADLCSWFGVTRQAYYQHKNYVLQSAIEEEVILIKVADIREDHKRMGGRKLYYKLGSFFLEHDIKMGRDAFFDLLSRNKLLVRKRKRYHVTTNSKHWMKKYPNLIKDIEPMGPNHIWVSDITYWKTKNKHLYVSLVTDAYSRKIVGYQVASTMAAVESVGALKMAIRNLRQNATGLIHHSDRGSQYCSAKYVKLLKKHKIQISMTENGDPLENAIAERLNGIIKGEYLVDYQINSLSEAKKVLESVVRLYNNERPHSSISNMVPSQVYEGELDIEVKRLWKSYYNKQNMTTV
jgi:putative transposase